MRSPSEGLGSLASVEELPSPWSHELLNPARIEALVESLIPSDEVRQGRNFGVHIVDGKEEASNIGRYVEYVRFYEVFGNDLPVLEEEYGPYDASSTFLVAIDYEKKQPAGALRIIYPSANGLKSLHDLVSSDSPWFRSGDSYENRLVELGDDPAHTIDIPAMAVMSEYKSGHSAMGVSAALYSSCIRWSLAKSYNNWVTIVDKKIYEMMQAWGEPFTPLDGATWARYIDSEASLPIKGELYSGLEKIKQYDKEMTEKFNKPFNIYGLYTQGVGLADAFVLPTFA